MRPFYITSTLKIALLVSVISLGGCDKNKFFYEPSTVKENRIEVSERSYFEEFHLSAVDESFLSGLAKHYARYGGSTMQVSVTYDPLSSGNTAMMATDRMAEIVGVLRGYGVRQISSGVMPVKGQGDQAMLLVSYTQMQAHAPKGCETLMPGLADSAAEPDRKYKLGCTIDSLLAKQIARPADLLGNENTDPTTDGRAASNIVDVYRSGAENPSLGGESSSGN